MRLLVTIVFFGPLPPWMPLTLHSMHLNGKVSFVLIGDAAPPALLPPNVRFKKISYTEVQHRLSELLRVATEPAGRPAGLDGTRYVRYNTTYKANDIKPLVPALFPQLLEGHDWWAWADLDVVFGNLLKFMDFAVAHPACCRVAAGTGARSRSTRRVNVFLHRAACPCPPGANVNVISPLFPNPWLKKVWGPFTAFEARFGAQLFRSSPQWREIISTNEYTHFDEWWGPFRYERGWETMGDVVTRAAEVNGSAILSRLKLPFAEAKSCGDAACFFCPCGAMRLILRRSGLTVNEREVMMLHLAESKWAWMHSTSASSIPSWKPPVSGSPDLWAHQCVQVRNLGWLNQSCGATCSSRAPTWTAKGVEGEEEHATRMARHRVVSKWARHIKYASATSEASTHPLTVGPCDLEGERLSEIPILERYVPPAPKI